MFTIFALFIFHLCSALACSGNQAEIVEWKSGETGSLSSPGYGTRNVPINVTCSWTLKSPLGEKIRMEFQDFHMKYHPLCLSNGLLIFNQSFQQDNLLSVYCVDFTPDAVTVDTSILHIYYYNYEPQRFRGFKIKYSSIAPPRKCQKWEKKCRNGRCVSNAKVCDLRDDCGDGTDEENCGVSVQLFPKCGKRRVQPKNGLLRIVGGQEATPGSWPWQVTLKHTSRGHQCGASLINAQWIVTAAHCFRSFRDKEVWRVYVGKHHQDRTDPTEQTRYMDKIIIHPNFDFENPQKKENDIALVKLNVAVQFNRFVYPVCLPKGLRPITGRESFYVTGWGVTLGSGREKVLNEVSVAGVEHQACKKIHRGVFQVTPKMICAGNGTHDSCVGDSGGPLVGEHRGTWHLAGIVSFGDNCGTAGKPGVYTHVRKYLRWMYASMILQTHSASAQAIKG